MLKFFRLPFATTGDKTAVPDAVDSNGNVSYSQGYGFDYQRQKTDPAAKNIERDKMNQVFFDMTTAIAELQSQGVPDFISTALNGGTAYSYAQYAVVKYSGDLYISLVAANTALPSDATKWALLPTPARIQSAFNSSAVATGTADAILGAFTPAIAALPASPGTLSVFVRAGAANTTTTPTFKADGTTAKTIVKGANTPLVAGDIAGAGHWLELQYDATLDKWVLQNPATGVTITTGLPQNYLAGLTTATNAGAATTKIDIAAGRCRSDDNTTDIVLAATLTKQLNAAWVAGNNGGLDTGAVAANTGYHVWAIYNPTSGISDALFSTSATAPTMPSGYTKKRWIGWIRTDGSSLIRPYFQRNDTFLWKTPALDVNGATIAISSGSSFALPVPSGLRVKALVNIEMTGGDVGWYAHSPDTDSIIFGSTVAAPANLAANGLSAGSGVDWSAGYYQLWTDTSAQIRIDGTSYNAETVYVSAIGWESDRGRNS